MLFSTKKSMCALAWSMTFAFLLPGGASVSATSPLYVRGYTVIPEPQKVQLKGSDFEFDNGWRLELGEGVKGDDAAIESLKDQLTQRYQLSLATRGRGKGVALVIHPGLVEIGQATDRDKAALAEQAYRLELGQEGIRITANASTGLFYGVQTLVQLVKAERGKLWLPEGEILDWPDVGLREVFWDELEHLDHFDVL
jgi:hexosaminidase